MYVGVPTDPPPPGSPAADHPTRRPPRFRSTKGGGGRGPPPLQPSKRSHTPRGHTLAGGGPCALLVALCHRHLESWFPLCVSLWVVSVCVFPCASTELPDTCRHLPWRVLPPSMVHRAATLQSSIARPQNHSSATAAKQQAHQRCHFTGTPILSAVGVAVAHSGGCWAFAEVVDTLPLGWGADAKSVCLEWTSNLGPL